ncbi:MAG: ABC transporter ATP-binding protein [Blastocatellia bacterium]|nr:ABC transporter ATP-binding protein [Blastocatellia bacterium]MBL8196960.1 ABC transporter ATP-binding protein [Blastocatellia bacterium]MBN8725484.1 ABC transporter ATP-binding protein [Acidobacteriota bacterium]
MIIFEDVSKFYGEILGVNKINLSISRGITSLVGPNGSGKTTLMNLMSGLLQPTQGSISVLGISPNRPEKLFRKLGYCAQFDSFPRAITGRNFIQSFLEISGYTRQEATDLTNKALTRVNLVDAASRKVDSYSKGMRQRIRLAQAIAHNPEVLVLDEPLNGLDPMARAEVIALFRDLSAQGMYLIVSSHILHEVDMMSDRVVLINNGYIVADGDTRGVRSEMQEHPLQILIRCDRPSILAAKVFQQDHIVEARLHKDRQGLFIKTIHPEEFYLVFNKIVLEEQLKIESIHPVDDDLNAVYQYLIGSEGS